MDVVKTFLKNRNNQFLVVIAVVVLLASIVFFFKHETVEMFSTGLKAFSSEAKDHLLDQDAEVKEITGDQDFGADYNTFENVENSDITKPDELLPKVDLSEGVKQAFEAEQMLVGDNYLTPGEIAGVNTVQSSLKNANLDIRAAPSIPYNPSASPWSVSTIETDNTGLVLA